MIEISKWMKDRKRIYDKKNILSLEGQVKKFIEFNATRFQKENDEAKAAIEAAVLKKEQARAERKKKKKMKKSSSRSRSSSLASNVSTSLNQSGAVDESDDLLKSLQASINPK